MINYKKSLPKDPVPPGYEPSLRKPPDPATVGDINIKSAYRATFPPSDKYKHIYSSGNSEIGAYVWSVILILSFIIHITSENINNLIC